jgi:hypothetical protein
MNRNWLIGIGAGVLVAAALILVGAGAYRAGERNATDVEVVGEVVREGESVARTIVIDGDGWHRGPGFFPGFFVFPLIVLGIVLLVSARRRAWNGPRRYYTDDELADWHRRAHGEAPTPPAPTPPAPTPPAPTPNDD